MSQSLNVYEAIETQKQQIEEWKTKLSALCYDAVVKEAARQNEETYNKLFEKNMKATDPQSGFMVWRGTAITGFIQSWTMLPRNIEPCKQAFMEMIKVKNFDSNTAWPSPVTEDLVIEEARRQHPLNQTKHNTFEGMLVRHINHIWKTHNIELTLETPVKPNHSYIITNPNHDMVSVNRDMAFMKVKNLINGLVPEQKTESPKVLEVSYDNFTMLYLVEFEDMEVTLNNKLKPVGDTNQHDFPDNYVEAAIMAVKEFQIGK